MKPVISESGFWIINDDINLYHKASPKLANWIGNYLMEDKDKQLIDFGCGNGEYIRILNGMGFTNLIGFEGYVSDRNSNIDEFDLSTPIENYINFSKIMESSWNSICLEVGEHIPKQYESTFLNNITKLTKNKIILSWAVKGQPGEGHVNCLNNHDVIEKMKNIGFKCLYIDSALIRKHVDDNLPWFKNTLMIFQKVY